MKHLCLLQCYALFTKQYGCFKLIHFSKISVHLSSAGPEILVSGSHCSVNFQPILDCFIPNFKLNYEVQRLSRNFSKFLILSTTQSFHTIKEDCIFLKLKIYNIFTKKARVLQRVYLQVLQSRSTICFW